MGHSTLSFFFLTLPPMTRMKARWSMQSLKRRVWTIVWVFRIATFCKDLINGRIFVRGSIWMLLFLALCFIHIQDRSLFTQTQRLFHWCPQVWMCGGPTSIWTIMMNPRDIEMKDISNVFFDTVCDKHEIPECTKKPAWTSRRGESNRSYSSWWCMVVFMWMVMMVVICSRDG